MCLNINGNTLLKNKNVPHYIYNQFNNPTKKNLKNEIITELLQKINIIENSFQKNYNYHKNVFELINTLLCHLYLIFFLQ